LSVILCTNNIINSLTLTATIIDSHFKNKLKVFLQPGWDTEDALHWCTVQMRMKLKKNLFHEWLQYLDCCFNFQLRPKLPATDDTCSSKAKTNRNPMNI